MAETSQERRTADDQGHPRQRAAAPSEKPSKKGGILAALRRSPLVGADLNLVRASDEPSHLLRKIKL
jgi:hypothetical protein